jgi:hypothetical protein
LVSKGTGANVTPAQLLSEFQLLGLFVFYFISLFEKVFNQQESVKQALWCNNSACFVINIPRQS